MRLYDRAFCSSDNAQLPRRRGLCSSRAEQLGIERSALLRDALRLHLNRLAAKRDADTWLQLPLTDGETTLSAIADWGPAEEWEDWVAHGTGTAADSPR